MIELGQRVRVWNGDQSEYLGEGTYEAEVPLYFFTSADGTQIRSSSDDPESEPPIELVEEMKAENYTLLQVPDNPRIRLDSGKIVYGCATWWEPLEEN